MILEFYPKGNTKSTGLNIIMSVELDTMRTPYLTSLSTTRMELSQCDLLYIWIDVWVR